MNNKEDKRPKSGTPKWRAKENEKENERETFVVDMKDENQPQVPEEDRISYANNTYFEKFKDLNQHENYKALCENSRGGEPMGNSLLICTFSYFRRRDLLQQG